MRHSAQRSTRKPLRRIGTNCGARGSYPTTRPGTALSREQRARELAGGDHRRGRDVSRELAPAFEPWEIAVSECAPAPAVLDGASRRDLHADRKEDRPHHRPASSVQSPHRSPRSPPRAARETLAPSAPTAPQTATPLLDRPAWPVVRLDRRQNWDQPGTPTAAKPGAEAHHATARRSGEAAPLSLPAWCLLGFGDCRPRALRDQILISQRWGLLADPYCRQSRDRGIAAPEICHERPQHRGAGTRAPARGARTRRQTHHRGASPRTRLACLCALSKSRDGFLGEASRIEPDHVDRLGQLPLLHLHCALSLRATLTAPERVGAG